jgi:hypothetical protein
MEILTPVFMMIVIFCNMTPCILVGTSASEMLVPTYHSKYYPVVEDAVCKFFTNPFASVLINPMKIP